MRVTIAAVLLLLSLAGALAQPPEHAQGKALAVGRREDAMAVGNAISEAARGKWQPPSETSTIVAGEYLVSFALDTSPSVINEAAR